MIIPAARTNRAGNQVASTMSYPAPTGGWNARDALAEMAPSDAIAMDNYFPGTQSVDLRNGSLRHATITRVTSAIESLIAYDKGAAHNLLACGGGGIWDVSAGGNIGAALATGFSGNRWQDVSMGGYQLLFNGSDTPQKYDGTAVTANTITGTGLTPSNLIYPYIHGQRVFAVEKDTLHVWYLGLQAISGPASLLDFSCYCRLGGSMVAMGSWSQDGGNGPQEYAVFVTSMGEVVVYQGYDPANASTWALVGVYRIGAPIGQRPLIKAGSDLIVIGEDGFVPLSEVMSLDRVGAEELSISDKIRDAVSEATRMYKNNFGWQAMNYPQGNWLLFNVPAVENTTQYQYVVNTLNKSWCRFVGMNANCWALYKGKPFFGGQGMVIQADTGNADDNGSVISPGTNPIQGDVKTSFQYFNSPGVLKKFNGVRPLIGTDGNVNVSISVCVDYEDVRPTGVGTPPLAGAIWGQAIWDVTPWSTGVIMRKNWVGARAIGYSAAMHLRTITSGISISLYSIDWIYEMGGVI